MYVWVREGRQCPVQVRVANHSLDIGCRASATRVIVKINQIESDLVGLVAYVGEVLVTEHL